MKGYIFVPNRLGQNNYIVSKTMNGLGRVINEKQAEKLIKTKLYKIIE